MSMNRVFHNTSKNIDIKYHYVCDMVQKEALILEFISTDE
jgi:hypothetical protein